MVQVEVFKDGWLLYVLFCLFSGLSLGGLVSIPGQFISDLWCTKWH